MTCNVLSFILLHSIAINITYITFKSGGRRIYTQLFFNGTALVNLSYYPILCDTINDSIIRKMFEAKVIMH